MTVVAAVLAAAAALLLAGGRTSAARARLGRLRVPPPKRAEYRLPPTVVAVLVVVGAVLIGGVLAGPVVAVGTALAVPGTLWWLRRRRARRERSRRENQVGEGCLALAGELAAGVPPSQALAVVAAEWPELFGPVAGRAALGGDPVPALRDAATRPGAAALTAVAAAWEVSGRTGAGLSAALICVADAVRAEAAIRREAGAQLAAVRATSRLMACLPVATLLLFSAGDDGAITFLTATPYGLICLLAAAAFIAAGVFWVDRAARSVRSVWEP
ncbi:type II secretion system F family protein [Jiangella gansuensis]|uniref:type II secretion system F family protein n=1 Tax=Jiangella gansuensis TaxID=281473 RepID=UPI0004B403AD|nr:type II secretion system F family protein [Jiangella gansuensis]